jgi:20S proteasome alpha/beta subunit
MIKPFPKPSPKLMRLPERRAVTIVAGFKCVDGIVLCADTEETIGDVSKRHVPKLRLEPRNGSSKPTPNLAVAFCGSTNNGPFMDKIINLSWEAAVNTTSLAKACTAIQESIENTYKHFGRIYQNGYLPDAELIYGVKMQGTTKLFHALGPVVNEKERYYTSGAGCHLADFLASRLYTDTLNTRQSIILAAYILFQAKEHVPGCGGDSHIAVLEDGGLHRMIDIGKIEGVTHILRIADREIGKLIFTAADFNVPEDQFIKEATKLRSIIMHQAFEDVWQQGRNITPDND